MSTRLLDNYLLKLLDVFSQLHSVHTHTHLKYMQTHNNECVDILEQYPVHCLPNNTNQVSVHSVLCMY